jgi:hypothetical protein
MVIDLCSDDEVTIEESGKVSDAPAVLWLRRAELPPHSQTSCASHRHRFQQKRFLQVAPALLAPLSDAREAHPVTKALNLRARGWH